MKVFIAILVGVFAFLPFCFGAGRSFAGTASPVADKSPSSPIFRFNADIRMYIPGPQQLDPNPGYRHWSSFDRITWRVTYQNGQQDTLTAVSYMKLGPCKGVALAKSGIADLRIFIPNPGCPQMMVRFRIGSDFGWVPLGWMDAVAIREP